MPNWCMNKLTVTGPEADVQRFKEMAVGQSPWLRPGERPEEPNVLNFHSLVPIPDEVLAAGYADAGYDWEVAHWGCKWGARDACILDEWDGHIEYEFNTAWSPPIEFLEQVAKQFPSLLFLLDYDEPGMAYKGIAKFQAEQHEDHCLEY